MHAKPWLSRIVIIPPLTVPATAEAESRDPNGAPALEAAGRSTWARLSPSKSTSPDAGAGAKLRSESTAIPGDDSDVCLDDDDAAVSESEAAGAWQQSVCAPARGAIDRV